MSTFSRQDSSNAYFQLRLITHWGCLFLSVD